MQAKVINVAANTITVDTLMNHAYTVAGTVGVRSTSDMKVNGSVTPSIFSIKPLPGQKADFNGFNINMISISADTMDFSTFGGRAALTRGIVARVRRAGGDFRNLFNIKTNGEIIRSSVDHDFLSPKGGNTNNGFHASIVFNGQMNNGVTIRLDGDLGEEFQLVVQDNLTINNLVITATAFGSELQE